MRWLFVSVVAGLACSPMPAPVDAGRPSVDAGPPRVVDGGVVGPFSRGLLLASQTVREEVTRTTASFAFSATFTEVAAGTRNPCIERREGACSVRICNQGERVEGTTVSPGKLTLEGLLPVEAEGGRDAGPVDAGNERSTSLGVTACGRDVRQPRRGGGTSARTRHGTGRLRLATQRGAHRILRGA
jgi:hypothetical protein